MLPVSIAASSIGAPLFGYLLDSGMAPERLWTLGLVGFAVSAVFVLLAKPPRAHAGPPPAALPIPEMSRGIS